MQSWRESVAANNEVVADGVFDASEAKAILGEKERALKKAAGIEESSSDEDVPIPKPTKKVSSVPGGGSTGPGAGPSGKASSSSSSGDVAPKPVDAAAVAAVKKSRIPEDGLIDGAACRKFLPKAKGCSMSMKNEIAFVVKYPQRPKSPRSHTATWGGTTNRTHRESALECLKFAWDIHHKECKQEACPYVLDS